MWTYKASRSSGDGFLTLDILHPGIASPSTVIGRRDTPRSRDPEVHLQVPPYPLSRSLRACEPVG